MIEKLTLEQEARFEEFRNKWLAYGLSTDPADRALAEQGVEMAYKAAGLTPPKNILWVDGPIEGARVSGLAEKAKDMKELRKLMKTSEEKVSGFNNRILGQFDAGWGAHYDFFLTACELECVKPLEGLLNLAKSVSWWWAFEDLTILCERPTVIARDDQGRLHSATGPCVAFRDGFEFYSWHGTVVPKEWIVKKPSAAEVLNCTNVEQRRAGAEIVGWETILRQLNARVLDKDSDPMMGELLEVDLPEAPKSRFIRVQCGTGRTFCLPVPPHVKTAVEANCWTYGIENVGDMERFRSYKVRT